MQSSHIIVDGLDTRYTDMGSGQVWLFLHGWGTRLETFGPLIASLGGGKRIVTLDLPGFGESQVPSDAWNVARYAEFVRHFLNKLSIGEPKLLIGHSLGGRIAIKAAARGFIKPACLVLIASAGMAESRVGKNLFFMVMAKIGKVLFSIPPLTFLKTRMRQGLYGAAGAKDYLNTGPLRETFLNITRENLASDAGHITIPTLLIYGESDTETPLAEARKLNIAIAGSELKVLPGSHFIHEEKPQDVAGFINHFLQT